MILYDSRWVGQHGIGRFAKEVFAALDGAIAIPNHGKPSHPLDPFYTSKVIRQLKPDLYFSPGYNPPFYLTTKTPYVFTLHDLIHLEVKEESSLAKKTYYEVFVKPAVHRAHKIFTVSNHARACILDWSGVSDDKVVVVGNGVSQAFSCEGLAYKGDRPYFFYVGNHRPHKNIEFLLRGYSLWSRRHEVDLYFSGLPASHELIKKYGLQQGVHFIGKVDDVVLATYYRGAIATVMSSTYEGFGLPALESMACGVPVIVAPVTSLPEVVGQGGVYIDLDDVDSLRVAFDQLYDDAALRSLLVEKALVQSQFFSWAKTNAIMQGVLNNALS